MSANRRHQDLGAIVDPLPDRAKVPADDHGWLTTEGDAPFLAYLDDELSLQSTIADIGCSTR